MLPGDDVLDVMPHFAVLLSQPAVLATLVCTAADKVTRGGVHLSLSNGVEMLASLELQDRDELCGVDQYLVLRPLAIAQNSFIGPLGKLVDPLLHRGVNLEID